MFEWFEYSRPSFNVVQWAKLTTNNDHFPQFHYVFRRFHRWLHSLFHFWLSIFSPKVRRSVRSSHNEVLIEVEVWDVEWDSMFRVASFVVAMMLVFFLSTSLVILATFLGISKHVKLTLHCVACQSYPRPYYWPKAYVNVKMLRRRSKSE